MSEAFLVPGLDEGVAASDTLNTAIVAFWKLNEATGAARADSAGANTLTNNNTVTQAVGADGVLSNASGFVAASTQYLSIADNAALSMGAGVRMTMTGWVYATALTTQRGVVSKFGAAGAREYQLVINGTPRFSFTVSSDGTASNTIQATTFGAPLVNTWYFVACYYDGANVGISVNNGAFNTGAFSADIVDGTTEFDVGRQSAAINYLDGRIEAVGLWKRVLTAAELTRLYNGGVPLVPTSGVWATAA